MERRYSRNLQCHHVRDRLMNPTLRSVLILNACLGVHVMQMLKILVSCFWFGKQHCVFSTFYCRLAGAALVAPVVNYWWPSFPSNLSREVFKKQFLRDQWGLRVAHNIPQLLYWWLTQKWFPSSSLIEGNPEISSVNDKAIIEKMSEIPTPHQVNWLLFHGILLSFLKKRDCYSLLTRGKMTGRTMGF